MVNSGTPRMAVTLTGQCSSIAIVIVLVAHLLTGIGATEEIHQRFSLAATVKASPRAGDDIGRPTTTTSIGRTQGETIISHPQAHPSILPVSLPGSVLPPPPAGEDKQTRRDATTRVESNQLMDRRSESVASGGSSSGRGRNSLATPRDVEQENSTTHTLSVGAFSTAPTSPPPSPTRTRTSSTTATRMMTVTSWKRTSSSSASERTLSTKTTATTTREGEALREAAAPSGGGGSRRTRADEAELFPQNDQPHRNVHRDGADAGGRGGGWNGDDGLAVTATGLDTLPSGYHNGHSKMSNGMSDDVVDSQQQKQQQQPLKKLRRGAGHVDIQCPSLKENSACPCYKFDDGE